MPRFTSIIRNNLHQGLLKCGWDLRRRQSWQEEKRQKAQADEILKWRFLRHYQPDTVIDVGANVGQFASLARHHLPDAQIIAAEPLPECIRALHAAKSRLQPIEILPFAIGDESGERTIYHNASSPSSSLLEMQELHWNELPHTKQTKQETIQIRRLDDLLADYTLGESHVIKVDVQGYTLPVLRGGEASIRKASAVIAEISTRPLYKGESNFAEVYELLRGWGFEYRGNVDQWQSGHDGRILQCDCLFENNRVHHEG